MTTQLAPAPIFRAWDNLGLPLVGGKLFTYVAGTTTKQATFTDSTGGTPNTNPVILNYRGEANVWLDPTKVYKFVLSPSTDTDPPTNPFWTVDQIIAGGSNPSFNIIPAIDNLFTLGSTSFSWANVYVGPNHAPVLDPITGNIGYYARTAAEIAASITPTNFGYAPLDARRYGYSADNLTGSASANRVALNSAIAVASVTINGAAGATVTLPTGIAYIDQVVILPNRVRIQGANLSGSIIKATPAFTTPISAWNSGTAYIIGNVVSSGGNTYSCVQANTNNIPPNATFWSLWPQIMLWANNGVTSTFDSILQDMFIDCSSVGGLGGILTDAWQENSGLRSVTVANFTTFGLKFRNVNAGGQAVCELKQIQLFPANIPGVAAGIQVDQISSVGSFLLHLSDSTIAGNPANPCSKGINIVNDSLNLDNVHFEGCTDAVYLAGVGGNKLNNISGIAGITNLVHVDPAFTGRLVMTTCQRNGSTNLLKNDASTETIVSDLAEYAYPSLSAQNSVKAWCSFDGSIASPVATAGSFNVQSITKNGTGDYTITFTKSMANTGYAVAISNNGNSTDPIWMSLISTNVGSTRFTVRRGGAFAGALFDVNGLTAMVTAQGGY